MQRGHTMKPHVESCVVPESQQLRQGIDELVRARVPLKEAVKEFKRLYVNRAIRLSSGNKSRAARMLGAHRNFVTRYADHKRTNREFLDRVRQRILADPFVLDMQDIWTDGFLSSGQRQYDIAALCLLESGRDPKDVLDPDEEARKLLRLTRKAADRLFHVWHEDVRRGYLLDPLTPSDYKRNAEFMAARLAQICA
jgi:hypothetical protein